MKPNHADYYKMLAAVCGRACHGKEGKSQCLSQQNAGKSVGNLTFKVTLRCREIAGVPHVEVLAALNISKHLPLCLPFLLLKNSVC